MIITMIDEAVRQVVSCGIGNRIFERVIAPKPAAFEVVEVDHAVPVGQGVLQIGIAVAAKKQQRL
jgi:hypothetical protein